MDRKIRIILAAIFFVCITLLFLDFTGTLHQWLGWMAKIQFVPAVLAFNVGVIVLLLALTLIFGRVYCSVICPLGVMQDIISWISGKRKHKSRRFNYTHEIKWLRYGMLVIFIALLIAGINSVALLIAPYSAYGRIASEIFAPVYAWGNNILAYLAERAGSYAFYEKEVWIKSVSALAVAAATLIIIAVVAWKWGRAYCNTICPVGTFLGLFSRFSLFRPVINLDKCVNCHLCEHKCKASCIDSQNKKIDYSRCVACMDCIDNCSAGAITYSRYKKSASCTDSAKTAPKTPDKGRRGFVSASLMTAAALTVKAQEQKVDGGLAAIEKKKVPARNTHIVPPGAAGIRNFARHCTACQLCVSVCPNDVLRPATDLMRLMQPEVSYEKGYCRPECTKCSEVCPTGAIRPISREEKSSIQIGHAVWIAENCLVLSDGVRCGHCADKCPAGAIQMLETEIGGHGRHRIPVVNEEKCIGCGTCENLCPARPFSAIYVEGHEVHRTI